RLFREVETAFGTEPLVMALPFRDVIREEDALEGGFTLIFAGSKEALAPMRNAFAEYPRYWLSATVPPSRSSEDGFKYPSEEVRKNWNARTLTEQAAHREWRQFGLAKVEVPSDLRLATDAWPYLYMRRPMLPLVSLRGIAVMGGLAVV